MSKTCHVHILSVKRAAEDWADNFLQKHGETNFKKLQIKLERNFSIPR